MQQYRPFTKELAWGIRMVGIQHLLDKSRRGERRYEHRPRWSPAYIGKVKLIGSVAQKREEARGGGGVLQRRRIEVGLFFGL